MLLFEPSRKKNKPTNIGSKFDTSENLMFFWRKSQTPMGQITTSHPVKSLQISQVGRSSSLASFFTFQTSRRLWPFFFPAERLRHVKGGSRNGGISRATTGSDGSVVGDVPKRLARSRWLGEKLLELQSQAFSNGWKW